jgi:uncharacterized glyoxalase superfamily protein PhnB
MTDKLTPLIITDVDTASIRGFYADQLGWEVVLDVDGYLQVRHGSAEADPELAFCGPEVAAPMGTSLAPFPGEGLVVSIPVADADAHHGAVTRAGAAPATEPTDKPWGARGYIVADPTGLLLDFFHLVAEPAAI